ncbi:MAG: hypothetical protein V4641_15530 [Pseudomonadota bacterium]
MFVVLRLQKFEMQTSFGIEARLHPDEHMVGFLPVYKTREEALADWPEGPVAEIREVVQ